MKKFILTVLSIMIFSGVFMTTEAKAERIWYCDHGNGHWGVLQDFIDKYPWVDFGGMIEGWGGIYDGPCGIAPNDSGNSDSDQELIDRMVRNAANQGVDVNPADVDVLNFNGNTVALVKTSNLSYEEMDGETTVGFGYWKTERQNTSMNGFFEIKFNPMDQESGLASISFTGLEESNSNLYMRAWFSPKPWFSGGGVDPWGDLWGSFAVYIDGFFWGYLNFP